MPGRRDGMAWLGLCAAGLVALTAAGLTMPHSVPGQFGIGYGPALTHFVLLVCAQGAVYGLAVWLVWQPRLPAHGLWLALGTAYALRLMILMEPPFLSNDLYRYIWDGWVQAAGINPYRFIPDDPHLAFLRDAVVYPNINRADYAHTIYPPGAQICFFMITRVGAALSLPPVLAMRLGMLGFEAVAMWAMLRLLRLAGMPSRNILIYAWNPLPLWEFSGSGHVDALTVCFIAIGLLTLIQARGGLCAMAMAAAVLTKFLPLVLLPAMWRRWDWKFAAVFLITLVLLYVPYLAAGRLVLGFLGGYAAQEGIASGQGIFLFHLLAAGISLPGGAVRVYLGAGALILAALALMMQANPPSRVDEATFTKSIARRSTLLGCATMLIISPHYPWYYVFLLIPACVVPNIGSLYLVTASFVLYLNPAHTKLLVPSLVFVPFILFGARDIWNSMKAGRTAGAGATI